MATVSDQNIVCSFCDKGVTDVEVMITGNGDAGICAACIEAATRIVLDRRGSTGVNILAPEGRRRRARGRQATKPTEHQVAVLEALLVGGYIITKQYSDGRVPWRLIDRDGSEWRDSIRRNTIGRLMDERWIERPDNPKANGGEHRWSISVAGRLVLARHRKGDFGLVVLRGGKP